MDENIFFDDIIIEDSGIPKEEKRKVYERDGNVCQLTGMKSNLSCHHIIASSHGGRGIAENLILVNRKWHDYLHFRDIPGELYISSNFYKLSRVNILRDILRIREIPDNFSKSYDYVRAMFDGIDKNDPKPPKNKENCSDPDVLLGGNPINYIGSSGLIYTASDKTYPITYTWNIGSPIYTKYDCNIYSSSLSTFVGPGHWG